MLNRKRTKKPEGESKPAVQKSWGGEAIRQIYEEMSKEQTGGSLFLPEFWLKENEGSLVQVISEEPYNCLVHSIDRVSKGGKSYSVNKTCLGEGCYYCEKAVAKEAGVKAAMLRCHITLLDAREFPLEKDGDKFQWTRRLARMSARRAGPLINNRKIRKRESLRGAILFIERMGTGMDTVWSYSVIEPEEIADDSDLSELCIGWNPAGDERIGVTALGQEFSFAPCPEFGESEIPEEFNYDEILKPDTFEEAASFLGNAAAPSEERESKGASIASRLRNKTK
jgi:hypothetical protein